MKILIVEDNKDLSESIQEYLTAAGYLCESAYCYEDARMKILFYEYDCILLDITLPDQSGLKILEVLSKAPKMTGVIIISAKDSLDDRIKGIRMGADDYLTKPFEMSELAVRIFSLIRRFQYAGRNMICYQEIKADTLTRKVLYCGKETPQLSAKEYDLLLMFLSAPHRVLTKENIAEHLYGDHADMFDDFRCVYAHIKKLKSKLRAVGAGGYIHSVYGIGYKFDN